MQKPFKFLNILNHEQVSQEILLFLEHHTDLINDCPQFWNPVEIKKVLQHVPSLKKFLARYRLMPVQMSVVIFDPATMYTRIHSDPLETYVRILWPVKNCLGSFTKFYDVPKEFLIEGTQNNWKDPDKNNLDHYTNIEQGVYYATLDREWTEIDQYELSAPIAFNGAVPHGVNPGPGNASPRDHASVHQDFRISFTVLFDQNLPISKSIDAWTDIGL
jgi:hypothetical protein